MKIVSQNGHLTLALPEVGMPLIIDQFADVATAAVGSLNTLSRAGRINGMDIAVPAAVFLPSGGMGHFGWPAIQGHRQGRQFVFQPSNWTKIESGSVVTLSASDPGAGVGVRLTFERLTGPVRRTRVEVSNLAEDDYTLDRCMAGSMLIKGGAEWIEAMGDGWGREFHVHRLVPSRGVWLQESRRGRTSHDKYPALVARDRRGAVYAAHLGWSGNHVFALDQIDDGQHLLHAGELFEPGEMILTSGETYVSPWFYMASAGSVDDVSAAMRQTVRAHVLPKSHGPTKPRPVLLNTWEGNYFAHDINRLKAQASRAADLGIERFVLDDGWFGKRDDDTSSLGDWFIDTRKYPDGLEPLISHVTGLGMEFGLWFEPEMVNPNSELYRQHPDWVLQIEGKPLLLSRNQLVLDLTRPEVCDYLFDAVGAVLRRHAISFVKWDMNRDLTHAGDRFGRAATSRQTRAFYALVDRLRAAFPDVEIESCASGGGRADYGVLERSHRIWTSDCTDPLERVSIQAGAMRFLPPEILGCHISASPNHQTRRPHSLAFRAIVAFFGHLGVELDPTALPPSEFDELKLWIDLHKSLRHLLHHADAACFHTEMGDGRHVFGVGLGGHVIASIIQTDQPRAEQTCPVPIPLAIARDAEVEVRMIGPGSPPFVRAAPGQLELLSGGIVSAGLLASHGLPIPQLYPQSAILLELKQREAGNG